MYMNTGSRFIGHTVMHLPQRMQVGCLDMSVLFFGEEQHACGALDGGGFKARCADTHHRAAENDLARGLDEAAALLGEVLKRSADAGESVYGSLEGAPATVTIRSITGLPS